jgi:uncharacterized Zn finger protein (UPF0148 family)
MTNSGDGTKPEPDIPEGFEPCHAGYACPSCNSSLIRKIVVESDNGNNKQLSSVDTNATTEDLMNCTLRTAKIANLLLTALSFDKSTRNSSPKPTSRIVPGVSYCRECKVHVVVDPNELELLFPDDCSEEWLRGCLFVAVDDKEVDALLTSQNTSNQSQLSQFDHIGPKKPQDFDYDYRHKVATKTMASKMTIGYTLTEDICDDCEMPLMENDDQAKECVVCPKLWLKIKRRDDSSQGGSLKKLKPILKADTHLHGDPADAISAIIAEARRATEPRVKQKTSLDKIVGGRVASSGITAVSISRTESTSHASTLTPDYLPDHYQEVSLALNNDFAKRSVSWDKLLVSGRLLLSKRLHQGWTFSKRNCLGNKCNGTPLMRDTNSSNDVCLVCGGSGNGSDGYYASEKGRNENINLNTTNANTEEEPNWEARIENGRSLLTQRLQQGWTMTTTNCAGYQCNSMPLIKLGSDPSSCVVCGGSGSGCDGIYEKFRSAEVVDAERELVSQEISHLMSMGWILRDSLCQQCLMPLVSEHEESDDLCILCGKVPSNKLVNRPVVDFSNDEVSTEAGKRLKMGWTLPASPLCVHCGGLQMIPPNSSEVGCIMQGCNDDTEYVPEPNAFVQNGRIKHVGRGLSSNAVPEQCKDVTEVVSPRSNMQGSQNDEPSSLPFHYVGIPHNDEDHSVLSDDVSQARSVASSALGQIIARLDDAKYELKALQENRNADPLDCTAKQIEIASLIEKLARACGRP